ncbi:MAG: purine-binding chemotaxis protein CheW [Anaerolineae bacterium]|nr:purine-binding chemotaxis protein CheW [Anaerolineae bacterium]
MDKGITPEIMDLDEFRRRIESDEDVSVPELSEDGHLTFDMLFSDGTPSPGFSGEKAASTEKVQAILEKRAQALARATEVETGETMQFVVFSLANETYGIPTGYVKEVQPLRDVSPVPCTPDFVVGVINIRGSIYSVVDIRKFLGVPEQEITDLTKVILVDAAGLEVGVLADDVSGSMSIAMAEIKPSLAAQATIKEEYIQGVTKDMLIILNLDTLMRDERVVVHEEVA